MVALDRLTRPVRVVFQQTCDAVVSDGSRLSRGSRNATEAGW
jgi:hypothetical protein